MSEEEKFEIMDFDEKPLGKGKTQFFEEYPAEEENLESLSL